MVNSETEKLQETLLDLLRCQEKEKQTNAENTAILSGLSAMAGANNKKQVFNALLAVLRQYISFEYALVLTREDNTSVLEELVTTHSDFESTVWPVHQTFSRALKGECISLFAPNFVFEFQFLEDHLKKHCQSALLTGVNASSGGALLLFLHHDKNQFTAQCQNVLRRFHPLLERAIMDIDYRERLQSLVTMRTQELIHSQERFQDFAKTVGDWFWEVDIKYYFTYISSTNMAGHKVFCDNLLKVFGDQPNFKSSLLMKLESKLPFEDLEWKLPESEGSRWISFSGAPYFDKQNFLIGYRGTAKDITIRKQHLFELQEAQHTAEKANKAKSEFLAMMSHEIRTPLNAVMGFMDTLSGSELSADQAEWIEQMDQAAQLLLTIINDILDLSRIESGKLELCLMDMNLHQTLLSVVNQLTPQAKIKNIQLISKIERAVPEFIYGDKNRIAQILFNLIGNAIKFTNKGQVSLTVCCDSKENNQICLIVKDTGIGIAKANQTHLFNPFIQADRGINRQYGGTGLGLSISQQLIKKMDGEISFESELKKGSVFTVMLPIKIISSIRQPKYKTMEFHKRKPLNVLLAEDSKTNQMVAKLMLEKRSCRVWVANNGKEAIEIMAKHHQEIDIILMDISMPILDGLQATKELRSLGFETPVIALTANAMESDKIECKNAGMNSFLSKPIQSDLLNAILHQYWA